MQKQELPLGDPAWKPISTSSVLDRLAFTATAKANPIVDYAIDCAAKGERMDGPLLLDLAKKTNDLGNEPVENSVKSKSMGMI